MEQQKNNFQPKNQDAKLGSSDATLEVKKEVFAPKNLEEFLNWVDFKTLNDIASEIQKKASVEAIKAVERTSIVTAPELFAVVGGTEETQVVAGGHRGNSIYFNEEYVFTRVEENVRAIKLLNILIHESMHLLSNANSDLLALDSVNGSARVGFKESVYVGDGKGRSAGGALNEAVTENLALKTLVEYLERTGNISMLTQLTKSEQLALSSYGVERIGLEVLVKTISRRLQLPEETIQQALVREYFTHQQTLCELFLDVTDILEDVIRPEDGEGAINFVGSLLFEKELSWSQLTEGVPFIVSDKIDRLLDYRDTLDEIADWKKIDALARALKLR